VLALGQDCDAIRRRVSEDRFRKVYTFNSARKSMSTVVPLDGDIAGFRLFTKGASEIVLRKYACHLLVNSDDDNDDVDNTRSNGTVHTSAKARLTGVAILIPIAPKFNHLFTGRLPTFPGNFMQTVWKFLCKVAKRQTDKQTNKQRRLHNLLGGGKQQQKAVVDIELRPQCCLLVSHFEYTFYLHRLCLADYGQT